MKKKIEEKVGDGQEAIFIGVWAPKDKKGNSLGKTFNVFAAPEDLKDSSGRKLQTSYNAAARRIACLKNWHGFAGKQIKNDVVLLEAIRKGAYKGEWFIPTKDILAELHRNKDRSDLKGTFTDAEDANNNVYSHYWSCTRNTEHSSSGLSLLRFMNGKEGWDFKGSGTALVRPVRLEARP